MVDWDYRWKRGPLEKYFIELGLYNLNRTSNGERWLTTPALGEFRACMDNPQESIGDLAVG